MMLNAPPNMKKIKENSDIANNILISSIDFGFKFDDLIVKNFLRQDYNFSISTKRRSHFTETIEFFYLEKK